VFFSHDTKVDSLRRSPLFADLSKDELEQLAKRTEDLEVPEGKILTREGETAQEFFVIIDGEVDVTKGGTRLRTLGEGDFFGEIGLFEDVPRTATVTAITPLRFFVLTRQSFWGMIDSMPQVERKILRALARRLMAQDPTVASTAEPDS
jgi:CRP-like cAMP-binding protein